MRDKFTTLCSPTLRRVPWRNSPRFLTVEWERTDGRSGIPFVWFGNQKRVPLDALMRWVEAQLDRTPAA